MGIDNCSLNSDCINTAGSYQCSCRNGYQEIDGVCIGKFIILPYLYFYNYHLFLMQISMNVL